MFAMNTLENRLGSIGTPLSKDATKVVLLGSGELGKEVTVELQRFGVEVVAADSYEHAPAMQVAHRGVVVDMLDADALRTLLEKEKPDVVAPEVEAIATRALVELEAEADWPLRVVPTATATALTMDREGIRRLAAEELELPTSVYRFVDSEGDLGRAAKEVGYPCVLKPVMSSSGKGQSVLRGPSDVSRAWEFAQRDARGKSGASSTQRCIVEGFVDFDDEITLLTVRHSGGVTFFDPIHHLQEDGDYCESWQAPQGESALNPQTLLAAQEVAGRITETLGGYGVFGVEMFIKGDEVIFSEVSPRPHDTGLVTMVSGDISQFGAHARAVLGLPVDRVARFEGAAASVPLKVRGKGIPQFSGVAEALNVDPSVQVRFFGKPSVEGERRVGVVCARGATLAQARQNAQQAAGRIVVDLV